VVTLETEEPRSFQAHTDGLVSYCGPNTEITSCRQQAGPWVISNRWVGL